MGNTHELVKICLQPRVSFALWVTAFVILVVPLPEFLSVDKSIEQYKSAIKLIGLFAFIYWIVEALLFGWERFSIAGTMQSTREEILDHLATLSPAEKFILARYIVLGQQTINWSKSSEVVALVSKGLLESVPVDGNGNKPFTMPRFVWSHLQRSKDVFVQEARTANPDKETQLESR